MRDWLESEWQRRGGGALVLLPFALVFALAVRVRRALYRLRVLPSWRPGVPVIVVGNVTVGGTGKTPLVIALVELLRAHDVPYELMVLPDGVHETLLYKRWIGIFDRMEDFLRRNLAKEGSTATQR